MTSLPKCIATTKANKQCSRNATLDSKYCTQHKNQLDVKNEVKSETKLDAKSEINFKEIKSSVEQNRSTEAMKFIGQMGSGKWRAIGNLEGCQAKIINNEVATVISSAQFTPEEVKLAESKGLTIKDSYIWNPSLLESYLKTSPGFFAELGILSVKSLVQALQNPSEDLQNNLEFKAFRAAAFLDSIEFNELKIPEELRLPKEVKLLLQSESKDLLNDLLKRTQELKEQIEEDFKKVGFKRLASDLQDSINNDYRIQISSLTQDVLEIFITQLRNKEIFDTLEVGFYYGLVHFSPVFSLVGHQISNYIPEKIGIKIGIKAKLFINYDLGRFEIKYARKFMDKIYEKESDKIKDIMPIFEIYIQIINNYDTLITWLEKLTGMKEEAIPR